MKSKTLGTTQYRVSPIGIGLAALGRPGYINIGHGDDLAQNYEVPAMEARSHAILDAAYERGVRYFDAARSYGLAEEFLGSWLKRREHAPGSIVVGSKWGYTYTADWAIEAEDHEVKEHSLAVLRRQWLESRSNLGSNLNLYQIHSATLESGVLDNNEILAELAQLKNDGTAIGISVSGPRQREVIEKASALKVDGAPLFDAVQATWNLLERSAGGTLADAREIGMGVIVKEALANGRLTDRNRESAFDPKMKILKGEARQLSTTVDAVALAAVLSQPWVDVVLSGAATVEHLQSNLRALEVKWDEEADSRLKALAESPEIYWKTRNSLAWN